MYISIYLYICIPIYLPKLPRFPERTLPRSAKLAMATGGGRQLFGRCGWLVGWLVGWLTGCSYHPTPPATMIWGSYVM